MMIRLDSGRNPVAVDGHSVSAARDGAVLLAQGSHPDPERPPRDPVFQRFLRPDELLQHLHAPVENRQVHSVPSAQRQKLCAEIIQCGTQRPERGGANDPPDRTPERAVEPVELPDPPGPPPENRALRIAGCRILRSLRILRDSGFRFSGPAEQMRLLPEQGTLPEVAVHSPRPVVPDAVPLDPDPHQLTSVPVPSNRDPAVQKKRLHGGKGKFAVGKLGDQRKQLSAGETEERTASPEVQGNLPE